MAEIKSRKAKVSRRGRSRGQRRRPTWEISDSEAEGAVSTEVGAEAQGAVSELKTPAKTLRADQVLRRLAVCVDPAVLEDAGSDILLEALGALGCECRIEPQRLTRSLQWRGVRPQLDPRCVPPEAPAEEEQEQLLLLEPQEFLQGAAQLTQVLDLPCSLPWLSPKSPTRPHLAVIGLDAYLWPRRGRDLGEHKRWSPLLRSHQPSSQKTQQLERSKEAHTKDEISWPEVEEALVLLQLCGNMDVLLAASWQELSQHVCAFTKALSQRPSKQYRDSQAFSFCTAGHWASGQRVTRDGSGLREVWWRQIRQFNRVSPAVANAVVTAFPSPHLLQQALKACSTEQERLGLLADLPVKAHRGRQPRRVGPDLSRRICIFLTTTNPNLLLDMGS